jgi:N-acetylated-alpha-linked acidic dipeptidase
MDRGRDGPVYHYHSNYDSHHWMRKFIDPDFSIHATCGQFLTLLVHRLASESLIPYSVTDFGRNVGYLYRDYVIPSNKLTDPGTRTETGQILSAYQRLYQVTMRWDEKIGAIKENATRVEEANAKFKRLQRLFVAPEGLPGREFWKHILYAPNRDDGELNNKHFPFFTFPPPRPIFRVPCSNTT